MQDISRTLPENIRRGVISHIVRYDLLRRQEFRDSFLSHVSADSFKQLAGRRTLALWELIVAGAVAYLNDQPMVTSDFHLVTEISRASAGRYVRILEQLEIFRLHTDEADRRRTIVELSEPLREALDRYVGECFEEFEELITSHHDRERRNAEVALQDSEERYRLLVELAPDAILIVTDDIIVFANNAAAGLFGAQREEQLVGRNVEDFMHPDYIEPSAQGRRRMLRQRSGAIRREQQALRLDGSVFDVEVAATFMRWKGVDSVQPILRDISERKRIERTLVRQALAIQQMSEAVMVINMAGQIEEWNPAAENIFGYSRAEMLGQTAHVLAPSEPPGAVRAMVLEAIDRQGHFGEEREFTHKSGERRICEITVMPLRNESGELIATVHVNRDITERKRAEEETRRQALALRQMSESALVVDLDGRILDWNPAAEALYGYGKEEILGQHARIIIDEAIPGATRAKIVEAVRRDGRWTGELGFVRKDGKKGIGEVSAMPLNNEQGELVATLSVTRDITKRKRIEQALQESERQHAEAQRVGKMGHFRTQLNPLTPTHEWSDQIYRIFGYEPGEIKPSIDFAFSLIHSDDRDRFFKIRKTAIEQKQAFSLEYRVIRKDGKEIVVASNSGPEFDDAGEVVALFGTIQDITERKRNEEALRRHTAADGVFFKRQGSPGIDSHEDLRGKAIAVMQSDATHDWLLKNGISENLILTKTVPEALRMVAAGKHEYAFSPRLVGLLIAKELDLTNLETTGPLVDVHGRGYGFAVKEGNSLLLNHLNEGLSIIKATGRYDAIYEKWFGIIDPKGICSAGADRPVSAWSDRCCSTCSPMP